MLEILSKCIHIGSHCLPDTLTQLFSTENINRKFLKSKIKKITF